MMLDFSLLSDNSLFMTGIKLFFKKKGGMCGCHLPLPLAPPGISGTSGSLTD